MKHLFIIFVCFFVGFSPWAAADDDEPKPEGGLKNKSELGVSIDKGNSDTEVYTGSHESYYNWLIDREGEDPWVRDKIKFIGNFRFKLSDGEKSTQNWRTLLKYERQLSNVLGGYAETGSLGDIFKGIESRPWIGLGVRGYIIKGDKVENYLVSELGFQYAREKRTPDITPREVDLHFVRLYLFGSKSIGKHTMFTMGLEILDDYKNKERLLWNINPAIIVETMKGLYLKVAFEGRYDAAPPLDTLKKFDYNYMTSLVATY